MCLRPSYLPTVIFFPTRKEYPKGANVSPMARYLKQVFLFRLPEMYGEMAQFRKQLCKGEEKLKRKKYQEVEIR